MEFLLCVLREDLSLTKAEVTPYFAPFDLNAVKILSFLVFLLLLVCLHIHLLFGHSILIVSPTISLIF